MSVSGELNGASTAELLHRLGATRDVEAWRYTSLRDLDLGSLHALIDAAEPLSAAGRSMVTLPVSREGAAIFAPRVITIAPNTEALLVESSDAGDGLLAPSIELRVGAGARVRYVQQVNGGAWHLSALQASVAAGASLAIHTVVTGGTQVRLSAQVRLEGEGAEVSVDSVFAPPKGQSHGHYVNVEHHAPKTRSTMRARAVIAEGGVGSFIGRVKIGRHVVGCSAAQLIKALLEGPGAVANLKPQLEIDCDDVTASHGASIGRLDPMQLFYLLSRGLPPDVARAFLVEAFLGEITQRLPEPELADTAMLRLLRGRHD